MLSALRYLAELPTEPERPINVVPYDDDASQRMDRYAKDVRAKHRSEGELETCIWARAAEKARKLAVLRAISANVEFPCVDLGHVQWAIEFVNHCHRLTLDHLGEIESSPHAKRLDRVTRIVQASEDGVTCRELARRLWRVMKTKEVQEHLDELVSNGFLETEVDATGPRVRVVYKWRS